MAVVSVTSASPNTRVSLVWSSTSPVTTYLLFSRASGLRHWCQKLTTVVFFAGLVKIKTNPMLKIGR
jgi:hypothetical protein